MDNGRIQFNTHAKIRLDAAAFEAAYAQTLSVPGQDLDQSQAQALRQAVALYQDDWDNQWNQDWRLFEQERLQYMVLVMLEKLLLYCERQQDFAAGITYGQRILHYDAARERTHRSLMRLFYQVGNYAEALRQYARCAEILQEALNAAPSPRTQALRQKIQAEMTSVTAVSPH